ncbi:UNVERIFIED_CONTAM: hypothetical protein FKN15_044773 [Acipenser sinensis]
MHSSLYKNVRNAQCVHGKRNNSTLHREEWVRHEVTKILDRKNNEIEELKNLYRTKQKESEEAIRKLEKKVQSLVRESQVIRKNNEIEELKNLYRTKQKESEEAIRKLEKKVQSLVRESQVIRESKENQITELKKMADQSADSLKNEWEKKVKKYIADSFQSLVRESQVIRESKENQITELKKMADQSADSLKNEWEKKLHNVVTEMEQEKFKLQKKHTENIQELLEDTNSRLSKMEAEYSAQTKATLHNVVTEMEQEKFKLQKKHTENIQELLEDTNSRLSKMEAEYSAQTKATLHVSKSLCFLLNKNVFFFSLTLCAEQRAPSYIKRYNALQREKGKLIEEHEQNIRQITASHDSDLVHFKQEHALSAAKAADVIDDLEQTVSQLKKQLQESEHKRQHQLMEQDSKFQLEKSNIEHLNDKKQRFKELRSTERTVSQQPFHPPFPEMIRGNEHNGSMLQGAVVNLEWLWLQARVK